MKKWFKILVLSLALFFCVDNLKSQILCGPDNYNTWILSNPSCYGCSSFYVMVASKPVQTNGLYYYDIYMWSNSFYASGYASNTYIKQVNIYAIDFNGRENLMLTFPYLVVPPKSYSFNGYFYVGCVYSQSPEQTIKTTWLNATIW